MRILYIVGEPGTGKSTLMRALTAPLMPAKMQEPVPHTALRTTPFSKYHAAEIGVRREAFAGTDGLSMSVQPKVLQWLEGGPPYPLLVAEGDRLANGKFFDAVLAMGYELAVLHLWAAADVVAARRAGRGGEQDAKWVQGRATKVANLVGRYSAFPLEARLPAPILAEHLAALPGPVGRMVRELREGRTRGPDTTAREDMLVVPQPGGPSAPAGLPDDDQRGAADADDRTAQADGESTADAAGAAPDGAGSDAGADAAAADGGD